VLLPRGHRTQPLRQRGTVHGGVVGRQRACRGAPQPFERDVQQGAHARVGVHDATGGVQQRDPAGNDRHQVVEAPPAPVHPLPGDPLRAHVVHDADQPARAAVRPRLHLGPAAQQPVSRQRQLDVVVRGGVTGSQLRAERRDLFPLDGPGAVVRVDADRAVELLQRGAALEGCRGQVERPGPDAGQPLQLGDPHRVHDRPGRLGVPLEDHDGGQVEARQRPADRADGHQAPVGTHQVGVGFRADQQPAHPGAHQRAAVAGPGQLGERLVGAHHPVVTVVEERGLRGERDRRVADEPGRRGLRDRTSERGDEQRRLRVHLDTERGVPLAVQVRPQHRVGRPVGLGRRLDHRSVAETVSELSHVRLPVSRRRYSSLQRRRRPHDLAEVPDRPTPPRVSERPERHAA
jgi:hypothetical protein